MEVETAPRAAAASEGAGRLHTSHHRADIEGLRAVAVVAVVLYHAGVGAASGGFVGVDAFFVISGFLITGLLWRELDATGRISLRTFYARRARRLLPASVLVIVTTVVASARWLSPLQARDVGGDGIASALYIMNHRLAMADTSYLDVASPSPLQHYWSLAVEEQFYVVWPALVILAALAWRTRGASATSAAAALTAVGILSFVLSLWLTTRAQPWAFFSLPTRAWEFVAGGLVALGTGHLRTLTRAATTAVAAAGLFLLTAATVAFDETTRFPGVAALAPVAGVAAIIVAGCASSGNPVTAALGWAPLRAIGRVSYSWYLWHWPALVLVPAFVGRALTPTENLAVVAAAFALAAITTRLVEDPIRFSPRLLPRLRLTFALAVVLTLAAAATSFAVSSSDPALAGGDDAAAPPTLATLPAAAPTPAAPAAPATTQSSAPDEAAAVPRDDPPLATTTTTVAASSAPPTTVDPAAIELIESSRAVAEQIAVAATVTDVPANLTPPLRTAHGNRARPFADGCFDGFADVAVHECVYGASPGSSTVVLFGDSHAAAWFPALEGVALARDQRLVVLAKATCPPLAAQVHSPNFGREYRECDEWRAAAIERIAAERPAHVVFAMNRAYGPAYGLPFYGDEWLQGLRDMIATVSALGTRVVVLGPVPLPVHDVPDCLSEHLRAVPECAARADDPFVIDGIAAERRATEESGAAYVDVRPWFCQGSACAVIVGNLLVYRDQNHITTDFATWLAPVVGASIDVAIVAR